MNTKVEDFTVVKFDHDIGSRVRVPTGDRGHVLARADYGSHKKYLVAWWSDNSRHDEWVTEWEVTI